MKGSNGSEDEEKEGGSATAPVVSNEGIERSIFLIRGERVILDAALAELYDTETRRLNEQVRRNMKRFPQDFLFRLSAEEFSALKSHFATSSSGWGGRRKLPFFFTEHGAIMADPIRTLSAS